MAEGVLQGDSLMTMGRTRGASYLAKRKSLGDLGSERTPYEGPSARKISRKRQLERGNLGAERAKAARDAAMGTTAEDTGFETSAEKLEGYKDISGVEATISDVTGSKTLGKLGQEALELGLGMTPLGAPYTAMRMGLGTLAAITKSVEEGFIGDMLDARAREAELDAVEAMGGYSDVAGMARTDRKSDYLGLDRSAFGLGTAYGTTTMGKLSKLGMAAMGLDDTTGFMGYSGYADPFGTDISLSNIGDFDFGGDTGYGSDSDMGIGTDVGATSGVGDIGDVGPSSLGSMSAGLGPDADTGGYEGFGGGGDADSGGGSAGGGHGARGGGSEGTSEAGGIGGY